MGHLLTGLLRPTTASYRTNSPTPDAIPTLSHTAPFEVMSRRYLKSPTIPTSHTGIAGWERPGDPMLAAAILDRVLHTRSWPSSMGSYRIRDHEQRSDALRRAVHPEAKPCAQATLTCLALD